MGIVRHLSAILVAAAFTAGSSAAAPGLSAAPAAPDSVARCTAYGQTCVERERIVDRGRIESRTRLHPAASRSGADPLPQRRPRLIVETRPGAATAPGAAVRTLRVLPRSGVSIVELRDGHELDAAIAELRADPDVLAVELDARVSLFDTVPEDPLWIEQWGLRAIEAPAAWDEGTEANDVIIAVIDTGVDLEHRDLGANVWVAPDGTRGYNCISDDADVSDDHGHGTHVAGIIAAMANADGNPTNDHGVAGVNWRARLLPMKFLDQFGVGYSSDAIACFEKIGELMDAGANIRVTNNSWGGVERTPLLRRTMGRLARRGVVHVAAAGNDGRDIDLLPVYPASWKIPGLISVGSSGISDAPSPFTNYGLSSVDLAAPGEYVMSTVPSGNCAACSPNGYAYGSGTSAAAPHVTGVVASVIQSRPGWKVRHVRDLILDGGNSASSTLISSAEGRLDFERVRAAVGASSVAPAPLNRHPRFVAGRFADAWLGGGEQLEIDLSAYDYDPTDQPTVHAQRPAVAELDTLAPLAWMIGRQIPQPVPGGPIAFEAPVVARSVAMPFVVSTADGRGGSARRAFVVTVAAGGDDQPPTAGLVLSPAKAPVGSTIQLSSSAVDPDGGESVWGYECNGAQGGFGEFDPTATSYSRTIYIDGRFRCRAYVVDDELNVVVSESVMLEIGLDGREPPMAELSVDRLEGTTPLTVQLDASASTDSDGAIQSYSFSCSNQGVQPLGLDPTGSCTFNTVGPHIVRVTVVDDDLRSDSVAVPIMVLPAGSPASLSPPATVTRAGSPEPESDRSLARAGD